VTRFDDIKSQQDKYVMGTYSRFDAALVNGHGATVFDADGKKYIDFGSGIGVNVLGYADPGWVAAVSAQAAQLAHISNLYYSPVQAQLAQTLCTASGFAKVFFCNSGAEANEGIIKLARKYSFDKYGEGRSTIVTLSGSFHGRTVTTLSATGQDVFHNYFFPFTGGFKYAQPNDAGDMAAALTDDVCAVLLEGVQGEGGVLPLEPAYVAKVAELAGKKDVLLLFDEVQTGIGRTGKLFSFENFGVRPDAVSCAKALAGGLPMGAVLCSEKLGSVLGPGTHATTFGGTPLVCAGALEVLARVTAPGFLDKVAENGEYIRRRLSAMKGVGNVRGLGMMIGFDSQGAKAGVIAKKALENGLMVLTAKAAVRLLPPLVITREETDEGLAILEKTLSQMLG
jgi:acetylornithine/N-succinyldiaminopimelate aminotransferase